METGPKLVYLLPVHCLVLAPGNGPLVCSVGRGQDIPAIWSGPKSTWPNGNSFGLQDDVLGCASDHYHLASPLQESGSLYLGRRLLHGGATPQCSCWVSWLWPIMSYMLVLIEHLSQVVFLHEYCSPGHAHQCQRADCRGGDWGTDIRHLCWTL